MRYISLDIESSGLDPESCQILSLGLVVEDTNNPLPLEELPSLHLIINEPNISGEIFALNMNAELLSVINEYNSLNSEEQKKFEEANKVKFVKEVEVVNEVFKFLYVNEMLHEDIKKSKIGHGEYVTMHEGRIVPIIRMGLPKTTLNLAGKNVIGFDWRFLELLPRWTDVFTYHRRVLDPAILFVDWDKDEVLPNLTECKRRAGIKGEVTHQALQDALDIVKLLRTQYTKS